MLQINNLNLNFKNFSLNDINLSIDYAKVLVILGKSGSGKTILLESIAGKYNHSGKILLNNSVISNVKPCDRNISLVYQNFGLFPFINVFENIIFAEKIKKTPKSEYVKKAEYLMKKLNIVHIKYNKIHNLSGGEKQRVSLARALMKKPELLLLDEPLSALDYINRQSAKTLIKQIISEYKITTVLVTHDLDECEFFADKVAFMKDGRINNIIDIRVYKNMKRDEILNEYI